MRIELNAGGLGRSTVNDFQDHLNRLISEAQNNADAFGTVKNAIYNLNGGVANMQHAMDLLQARETHEQDRKDYLQAVANQYNDFLNLAFRQDDQAAGLFSHVPANWVPIQIGIDIILPTWDPSSYQGKAIDILTGEESDSQVDQSALGRAWDKIKKWIEKLFGKDIPKPEPKPQPYPYVYNDPDSGYYGGNQMVFESYATANDEEHIASLREIYDRNHPGNEMTDEEFKEYLKTFTSVGCGYVAYANMILSYYVEHPDEWPYDYPMYVDGHLNYDAVAMDVFSRLDNRDSDGNLRGVIPSDIQEDLEKVLGGNGRSVSVQHVNNLTPEQLEQYQKEGKQVMVALYNGPVSNSDYTQYCGGHGMTVTGFDEHGNPIVSSWGEQYTLDPSYTNPDPDAEPQRIEYYVVDIE